MRIVVAGGTGFLGQPLCASLAASGHEVIALSRRGAPAPEHAWTGSPSVQTLAWSGGTHRTGWGHLIDGADAVVNLAGESIAGRRWTAAQKARLRASRLDATRAIVLAMAGATTPPATFLSGSAVGYYGSRGDEILTERSAPGDDFLARLAVEWEAEAAAAKSSHTRVALVRTGIVLGREGGALAKMLLPFKLGLGGPIGSGRQYMSWIHRDDWVALITWLLTARVSGPVNAVAPQPVRNADFARALGAALGRPAVLPAPAFALRLALGEMADALLLGGQRVVPERALEEGFQFRYATLQAAMEAALRAVT